MSGEHAVVLDADMTYLLAGLALSEPYDHDTVAGRDRLPVDAAHRKGTHYDREAYPLLGRDVVVIEEPHAGLRPELVGACLLVSRRFGDVHLEFEGHLLFQGGALPHPMARASRAHAEVASLRIRTGARATVRRFMMGTDPTWARGRMVAVGSHSPGGRGAASHCSLWMTPRSGRSTVGVQRGLPASVWSGPIGLVSGS